MGWSLFGAIWVLAVAGIVFKCFYVDRLHALSTTFYVLMGWLVVVVVRPLIHALPQQGFLWLMAGGAFYTVGVVFFASKKKYSHAIWHLFVLAGSACHFVAVYRFIL
jgi:hemolysin III